MVVCKYFLQGNCKFGNSCRNDHPSSGFASQNRFSPLSGSGGNRFGGFGNMNDGRQDAWRLNTADVRNDLTDGKGRPKWILSAYGPGKEAPASLLESDEFSPEEIRVRFYEMASQGKQDDADREAMGLWNKADQDINQILNNVDGVIKFMEEADSKHPNRGDFAKMDGTKSRDQLIKDATMQSTTSTPGSGPGFGQGSTPNPFAKPAASTFGQPSQPSLFGSSTFGKPAFGQSGFGSSSGQTSSPFGQTSSGSAFGKPAFGSSGFGQATFGQPSQPAAPTFGQPSRPTSTFGQPSQPSSTFGQPAFGSSGFGSAAQMSPFAPASASSGFGQGPSTFGQPSQPTSTFGQPSQPGSAFGQPTQPSSTFGQPSQPTSTFGQASQPTSIFGQASQPSSTFGHPSQPTSKFGQPTTFGKPGFGQSTSTFGQPSQPPPTFGQPSQPTSTFGQPSQSTISPFAQTSQSTTSPFGQAASTASGFGTTGFGTSSRSEPAFSQTNAPTNPVGVKPTEDQPNDQTMDTASPAESRPVSRANLFETPSTQPSQPAPSSTQPQPTAAAKPIVNTSSTPHPLTGKPPHVITYTQTLPPQPTRKNASGQVTSYRGQAVQYVDGTPCYARPDGKGLEKIWFPDAGATPEVVVLNREEKLDDFQGSEDEYSDMVKDEYRYLFENGRFKDGKIPLVPPLREWGVYDF
ncbi:uncharacterized protein Z518_09983 [Rhinocladiella mackenziei CBS 650.93]|uniref:C3H1-type domain-containing protein n=1 Tax=Rhinocladiella mackenziei CBS 650.93 TaxID=1442369 RepID=A0A0D2GRI2_9EURO|nr:uncharacterized protein Z518_09983 [Rhinocladiella mackenziei CBS 650.93]KIX00918.1 hypothetical protein Z518_09983 [Rhinocladiella mackenziei CBS 650.93]